MSKDSIKPSKDELVKEVNSFRLRHFSQKRREEERSNVKGDCEIGTTVLEDIKTAAREEDGEEARQLLVNLSLFTPHISCQASLVREAIMLERELVGA